MIVVIMIVVIMIVIIVTVIVVFGLWICLVSTPGQGRDGKHSSTTQDEFTSCSSHTHTMECRNKRVIILA